MKKYKLCNKKMRKPCMSEPRPCIRRTKHGGRCSPNLSGLIIGRYKIISRASDFVDPNGARKMCWTVQDQFGIQRKVRASHLLNGESIGLHVKRNSGLGVANKNGKNKPEYRTVLSHYRSISNRECYKGMPFYDDWNPDKGGSFITGMNWIIENLGRRPGPKHSMDIIEHHKGFVPGNLRWTLKNTQTRNQRHRTMFLLTINQHEEALRQLGYGIYKLGLKKD